jgi:hypothetical protein
MVLLNKLKKRKKRKDKKKKMRRKFHFFFSSSSSLPFTAKILKTSKFPLFFFPFPSSICRELLRESLEEEEKFY